MTISFREFDLDEYRLSIQAMTDEQLIQEGKTMRRLSRDGPAFLDLRN